jgi:hypothetical protein
MALVGRGSWEVNVGDEVWVTGGTRQWRLAKVSKIGSKLLHVEDGWKATAYLLNTQQRRDGNPGSFLTKAQREDNDRRHSVLGALKDVYGITIEWTRTSDWTTSALESLFGFADDATSRFPVSDAAEGKMNEKLDAYLQKKQSEDKSGN